MPTILQKVLEDLNQIYENFEEIDIGEDGDAFIRLEDGTILKHEDVEDRKTRQILEIYQEVA